MAYLLYKKIRDHNRVKQQTHLQDDASAFGPDSQQPHAPGLSEIYQSKSDTSLQVNDAQRTSFQPDSWRKGRSQEVSNEKVNDEKERKQQKKVMMKYRLKLMGGLFLPLMVFALNKTMVAAALPFIASDFHQFAQLNWIISAAELTSTAFIPAWGQFADIFGRYPTLQASIVIMIIGSALSGAAPTTDFPMLLAGRGFQGVGVAGMMVVTHIILSDKVSLKDNAANNTAYAFVVGIGFGIGPVIGGYLTSVSWRWVFYINIPLSAFGLVVCHFLIRPLALGPQQADPNATTSQPKTRVSRLWTIDFGGQLLFLFGMGLFVLALTWAGAYYPWADVKVLVPLVLGSALLILFLVWEYLLLPGNILARRFPSQQAMISLKLVWTRNAGVLVYINVITGMAMYAVFYFVDLYFTIVKDFGPSKSGQNLLYYLPGLGAGSYLSMFICNIWPRKTWYPLSTGTLIEATGITVLAAALHWNKLPVVYAMLAITGVGTGIRFMPNTLHAVGYHRTQIAPIISLMSLAMSFGSTLASTIMLNIFNNRMSSAGISLSQNHPSSSSSSVSSFSSIDNLSPARREYVRFQARESLVVAFYGISAFMWVGVFAVGFLGNVSIRKGKAGGDGGGGGGGDVGEDGQTFAEDLTRGAYIGGLFRRRSRKDGDVSV